MPEFKISDNPKRKYIVKTPLGKWIHFGQREKPHYQDRTGLGAYTYLNDNDHTKRLKMLTKLTNKRDKDGYLCCHDDEDPIYYDVHYLY